MKKILLSCSILACIASFGIPSASSSDEIESIKEKISDLKLDIKNFKQNKADKVETNERLSEINDILSNEVKARKSSGRKLKKLVEDGNNSLKEEIKSIKELVVKSSNIKDIKDIEDIKEKISDLKFDIKNIKKNKADDAETKEKLSEIKNALYKEVKNRKSSGKILNDSLNEEIKARESLDKKLSKSIKDLDVKSSKNTDDISDLKDNVSDLKIDIKYIKQNKADKVETETKLSEINDTLNNEVKDRKYSDKKLKKLVENETKKINNSLKEEIEARKSSDEELSNSIKDNEEEISGLKGDIKNIKKNKADKYEIEKKLAKINDTLSNEVNDRKSSGKKLEKLVENETKKINNSLNEEIKERKLSDKKNKKEISGLKDDITNIKKNKADKDEIEEKLAKINDTLNDEVNCRISSGEILDKKLYKSIKELDKKISDTSDKLNKKVDLAIEGTSLAIAMANLPAVSNEYDHNFSAAYGTFAGSHSLALGLGGHFANDRFNYKLSGAVSTKGNLAVGLGFSINFGKRKQTTIESLLKRIEQLEKISNNK